MYYQFFGLQRPPFKITPDTDFFYEGGERGAVLGAVIYAIHQGEGIVKITGEVGSGKTMLCRVLQQRLGSTIDMVYLANPSVAPNEILHAIAFELQLPIARDASRVEVQHALQTYLVSRHAKGRQVVVFVEESQGMPLETLEEIRLLSNLETGQHKLLQILLFGQPELDENLRKPHIRQLRERITHSFKLAPLSRDEIAEYLAFRLRAAGYRGPALFSKPVVDYIAKASEGLTRRVNIVADKAMLAAFSENTHTITLQHAKTAVADSEFSRGSDGALPWRAWLPKMVVPVLVAGVILLGLGLYQARNPPAQSSLARPTPAVALPEPAVAPAPPPTEMVASQAISNPPLESAGPAQSERSLPVGRVADPPQRGLSTSLTTGPTAESRAEMTPTHPPDSPGSLLEQRVRMAGRWILGQAEDAYTIQILSEADAEFLKLYLRSIPKAVDTDSIYVYRSSANAKPLFTVVLGAFPSPREAMEAIAGLPPELTRYLPYPRSFKVVRAEYEAGRRQR